MNIISAFSAFSALSFSSYFVKTKDWLYISFLSSKHSSINPCSFSSVSSILPDMYITESSSNVDSNGL